MTLYYCVRVYPNGEAKHTLRDKEGMENWVKSNKYYRPGNALFVNGKLASEIHLGIKSDQIEDIERQLTELPPHNLEVDTIGLQWEDGFRYEGYKPENGLSRRLKIVQT